VKYTTVQSFKQYFLHNISSLQLYISASDGKDVGNIHGSHFVKAFSALPLHSELYQCHHKSTVPSVLISVEATGKKQTARSVEVGPEFYTLYFAKKKILQQNRPVCWGIVVRRNHMLFLHISGRFLLTASLR
jgi:hypothetical protein